MSFNFAARFIRLFWSRYLAGIRSTIFGKQGIVIIVVIMFQVSSSISSRLFTKFCLVVAHGRVYGAPNL